MIADAKHIANRMKYRTLDRMIFKLFVRRRLHDDFLFSNSEDTWLSNYGLYELNVS